MEKKKKSSDKARKKAKYYRDGLNADKKRSDILKIWT